MKKIKLFQHGSIGTLMTGLFEGSLSINELLKHGDMGIGTFDELNGELIVLDGKAYQSRQDGIFSIASDHQKVAYALVGSFQEDETITFNNKLSASEVKEKILTHLDSRNTFSMFRIDGEFENVHVRTVIKQEKPYPRLINATKDQLEFNIDKCKGTIVGFYIPELYLGVSGSGFHLHFINDEKNLGGHLLNFTLNYGKIKCQVAENIDLHFPLNDSNFMKNKFDYGNLKDEFSSSEK